MHLPPSSLARERFTIRRFLRKVDLDKSTRGVLDANASQVAAPEGFTELSVAPGRVETDLAALADRLQA